MSVLTRWTYQIKKQLGLSHTSYRPTALSNQDTDSAPSTCSKVIYLCSSASALGFSVRLFLLTLFTSIFLIIVILNHDYGPNGATVNGAAATSHTTTTGVPTTSTHTQSHTELIKNHIKDSKIVEGGMKHLGTAVGAAITGTDAIKKAVEGYLPDKAKGYLPDIGSWGGKNGATPGVAAVNGAGTTTSISTTASEWKIKSSFRGGCFYPLLLVLVECFIGAFLGRLICKGACGEDNNTNNSGRGNKNTNGRQNQGRQQQNNQINDDPFAPYSSREMDSVINDRGMETQDEGTSSPGYERPHSWAHPSPGPNNNINYGPQGVIPNNRNGMQDPRTLGSPNRTNKGLFSSDNPYDGRNTVGGGVGNVNANNSWGSDEWGNSNSSGDDTGNQYGKVERRSAPGSFDARDRTNDIYGGRDGNNEFSIEGQYGGKKVFSRLDVNKSGNSAGLDNESYSNSSSENIKSTLPRIPNAYDWAKCIALTTMIMGHAHLYKVFSPADNLTFFSVLPFAHFLDITSRCLLKLPAPIFYFLVGWSGSFRFRFDLPVCIVLWSLSSLFCDLSLLNDALSPILLGRVAMRIVKYFFDKWEQNGFSYLFTTGSSSTASTTGFFFLLFIGITLQQISYPFAQTTSFTWGFSCISFSLAGFLSRRYNDDRLLCATLWLWHTTPADSLDVMHILPEYSLNKNPSESSHGATGDSWWQSTKAKVAALTAQGPTTPPKRDDHTAVNTPSPGTNLNIFPDNFPEKQIPILTLLIHCWVFSRLKAEQFHKDSKNSKEESSNNDGYGNSIGVYSRSGGKSGSKNSRSLFLRTIIDPIVLFLGRDWTLYLYLIHGPALAFIMGVPKH